MSRDDRETSAPPLVKVEPPVLAEPGMLVHGLRYLQRIPELTPGIPNP